MRRSVRGWILYTLAWAAMAVAYAVLFRMGRGGTVSSAVTISAATIAWGALLGVPIWWLSGKVEWSDSTALRFVVIQCGLAVVYTTLWMLAIFFDIASGTGFPAARTIVGYFIGWQLVYGAITYGLMAGAAYTIRGRSRLQEQQDAARRAEALSLRSDALRVRAELQALRGQLNPHFIFNTLHSVRALVRRDPATAEWALEKFGELLRYVLDAGNASRDEIPLADELAFVRNYLALEQLRFGTRLKLVDRIEPETLDCLIPSFTLQPLVENAVRYGIAPRAEGGTVSITTWVDGDVLTLQVSDDGPGTAMESAEAAVGLGLRAVRQRLETQHPGKGSLGIRTSPGSGFAATASLPVSFGNLHGAAAG